jgi:hypothetical protein
VGSVTSRAPLRSPCPAPMGDWACGKRCRVFSCQRRSSPVARAHAWRVAPRSARAETEKATSGIPGWPFEPYDLAV